MSIKTATSRVVRENPRLSVREDQANASTGSGFHVYLATDLSPGEPTGQDMRR